MIIGEIIDFTWCVQGSADRILSSVLRRRSPGMVEVVLRAGESRLAGREGRVEETWFLWFFQVMDEFPSGGDEDSMKVQN